MNKRPLWRYVVSVIFVLIVLNIVTWYTHGAYQPVIGVFSAGYLVGMLAMYIAVHFYRLKSWPIE